MTERFQKGPFVFERFGLEHSLGGAKQLAPFPYSPLCRNVSAYPGRVVSRSGTTQTGSTFDSIVMSITEYVSQDLTVRAAFLYRAGGKFSYESGGTYFFLDTDTDTVGSGIDTGGGKMNAVSLFGRKFLSIGKDQGLNGITKPMFFNGNSLGQVSPPGPAAAAAVADGGAGNIAAGLHRLRVLFVTDRGGFITAPGPEVTWTAAGSKVASVSSIPTGPSYVKGRILAFTLADDTDLYYIANSAMVINDNTTTAVTVDFLDSDLQNGVPVSVFGDPSSDLLRLIELPAEGNCFTYKDRICWLNERSIYQLNGDVGFRGMSFCGGFNGNTPNGWTQIASGQTKGTGQNGAYGDYLEITGDGTNQKACLENVGAVNGVVAAGTRVRVRLKVKKNAALAAGTFHVYFATSGDAAGAAPLASQRADFVVSTLASSSAWKIIEGEISAIATSISTTTRLRISAGGPSFGTAFSNTGKLWIDYIEVYNADSSATDPGYEPSLARWSRARQPHAYDGTTGFQYVAQDNGERLTSGFELGGAAYFVKTNSLWVTRDDGAHEPDDWPVENVSRTVGSPSARGVGIGDNWVAIASRSGLYFFAGGRPVPLSDHIRPTWDSINWTYANKIEVSVSMERRMIFVAAPLGAATIASTVMVFQWYGSDPATSLGSEDGVQMCKWDFIGSSGITAMGQLERSDGTRHFLFGFQTGSGSATDGVMARIDDSVHTDATQGIVYEYRTTYVGGVGFQRLWKRLTMYIRGSGTPAIQMLLPGALQQNLPFPTLQTGPDPQVDMEFPAIRMTSQRMAIHIALGDVGGWFSLEKLSLHPSEPRLLEERGRR